MILACAYPARVLKDVGVEFLLLWGWGCSGSYLPPPCIQLPRNFQAGALRTYHFGWMQHSEVQNFVFRGSWLKGKQVLLVKWKNEVKGVWGNCKLEAVIMMLWRGKESPKVRQEFSLWKASAGFLHPALVCVLRGSRRKMSKINNQNFRNLWGSFLVGPSNLITSV